MSQKNQQTSAQAIQKSLEKLGIKAASPDHSVYSTPLTVSFINRSGTPTPKQQRESDLLQKAQQDQE